jgi:hypothetical protein
VTELADEIKIRITMYPDRVPYKYACDIHQLREHVREILGSVGYVISKPGDGVLKLQNGGIEVEWQNTGLQELPEEGGGDN